MMLLARIIQWDKHCNINLKLSFLGNLIDSHKVEYLMSFKGNLQLAVDGYRFCRNDITKDTAYYYCAYSKSDK